MLRRFLLAFLCVVAGPLVGWAATVDILVTGGTVLTMAGPNIENGAVAIDRGKIVAVGPSADLAKRFPDDTSARFSSYLCEPVAA